MARSWQRYVTGADDNTERERGYLVANIIAKVNALLARAAHANTPEEEARTSALTAVKLAAKHGVTLTVGAAGDVQTVAEATAKVRVAEARAEAAERARRSAEDRAKAAEDRAKAAEARAERAKRDAEARADEANEPAAPASEKRARRPRASAAATDEGEIPNNRWGEPPPCGPQCKGSTGATSCDGAPPPAPPPRRRAAKQVERKVIESRFRGVCDHCDRGFKRGDRISWAKGQPTYHEHCAAEAAA